MAHAGSVLCGFTHTDQPNNDALHPLALCVVQVVVEPFKRGHKVETLWTNLYVKNVPFEWDDAKLKEVRLVFTCVSSLVVVV